MRVYELAKEAGVTSADVIKAAESCGAEVTNAISTIDDGELAALKLAVAKLGKRDVATSRAAKREKAAAIRRDGLASDRDALARHLATAKAAAEGRKVDTKVVTKVVTKAEPKAEVKAAPAPKPRQLSSTATA